MAANRASKSVLSMSEDGRGAELSGSELEEWKEGRQVQLSRVGCSLTDTHLPINSRDVSDTVDYEAGHGTTELTPTEKRRGQERC
jgi:hypothetical protein